MPNYEYIIDRLVWLDDKYKEWESPDIERLVPDLDRCQFIVVERYPIRGKRLDDDKDSAMRIMRSRIAGGKPTRRRRKPVPQPRKFDHEEAVRLNREDPTYFTAQTLAKKFGVSDVSIYKVIRPDKRAQHEKRHKYTRVCQHPGCENTIRKDSRTGLCKEHRPKNPGTGRPRKPNWDEIETATCRICERELPKEAFNKYQRKDGTITVKTACKECQYGVEKFYRERRKTA